MDESIVPPGVVMEGFAKFVLKSIKEEKSPVKTNKSMNLIKRC